LLILFALLGACTSGPQADLEYIKKARSIAAEWALVNEQAKAGNLTPTYVGSMHRWLRDDLQTAFKSLKAPNSAYGEQIRSLLAEPADAAPDTLRARADALMQIENDLESA
jgi:hypothetical protein